MGKFNKKEYLSVEISEKAKEIANQISVLNTMTLSEFVESLQ